MKVTLCLDGILSQIELNDELKLDAALLVCLTKNERGGEPLTTLTLYIDDKKIDIAENGPKTLQEAGLHEGSLLSLCRLDGIHALGLSNDKLTNLIRVIKIPKGKSKKEEYLASSMMSYIAYKTFPSIPLEQRVQMPLLDAVTKSHPGDFGAFHLVHEKNLKRKRGEAIPANKESKRRRMLEENMVRAYDELPESFTNAGMLYIKASINAKPITCLVDTGAQMSVMGETTAKAFGLTDLIDTRFQIDVAGVSGSSKALGKITYAVEGVEIPTSLTVVPDSTLRPQLILGLDTMLRHNVKIDLGTRVMIFGDSLRTPFMHPDEAAKMLSRDMPDVKEATETPQHNTH
ncbi:unnamed protein product, partial [Mesorhabditis spiculigera]